MQLPQGVNLPDGTEVLVTVIGRKAKTARSLHTRFRKFAGLAKDMPTDLARNHGHYLVRDDDGTGTMRTADGRAEPSHPCPSARSAVKRSGARVVPRMPERQEDLEGEAPAEPDSR